MPIYKPVKPYTQDINDLVDSELSKGKALPTGTIRNWSGTSYVKEANGDWKPVAHAKDEKPVEEVKQIKKQPWDESTKDTPEYDAKRAGKKADKIQAELTKLKAEYKEKFGKDYESPKSKVSDEGKAALKEYQSGMYNSALGGYANIQSHLRTGKPKYGTYTPAEIKLVEETAKHVSEAIKAHPVEKATTVYRGMKVNKDEPGSAQYGSLKVGDTFSDKGFTSTSSSKKVADKFTEKLNRSDSPILMEIGLKPGDHALPMNEYHTSSENEILLDRNTKFKVVSVSESKGIKKIKLEIV